MRFMIKMTISIYGRNVHLLRWAHRFAKMSEKYRIRLRNVIEIIINDFAKADETVIKI